MLDGIGNQTTGAYRLKVVAGVNNTYLIKFDWLRKLAARLRSMY